jgi:hypothetical protein
VSNVLSEEKKQQAVALGRLGWSLRRIQKAIGVRRETISVYLKAAGIAMRAPRGQTIPAKPASREEGVITDPTCAKPASLSDEVTTDSGGESEAKTDPRPSRSPSSSACIPHRDAIELGLSRGRNAMAIWQELVDTFGFAGGYQSVRRFVSRLHGNQHLEACAVIETSPREEAQVDYGDGPMVRDPQSGKYRRTRLFVLTPVPICALPEAVRQVSANTTVRPDSVPLPCRVEHPDRKGKVESGVGCAENAAERLAV